MQEWLCAQITKAEEKRGQTKKYRKKKSTKDKIRDKENFIPFYWFIIPLAQVCALDQHAEIKRKVSEFFLLKKNLLLF